MPSASDIRAGRAFVELYTKNGPLYAGLKAAQKKVSSWSKDVTAAGKKMMVLGGAITGPIIAASKVFASMGDTLDKMSARTGIAVEALSELGFAAEQGGADLAAVERGVKAMQNNLASGAASDSLQRIGLSLQALSGLDPEAKFTKIAEALNKVSDPSKKAAMAMKIFGKAGAGLLPMMGSLADVRQQARDLGLVVSTEDATRAAAFTDQLNILRRVLMQGVFTAGAAVADVLGDLTTKIVKVVTAGTNWIKQNKGLVVSILKIGGIITGVGAALVTVGTIGAGLAGLLGGMATAVTVFGGVLSTVGAVLGFILSPIGLVVAALAGLTAWWAHTSGAAAEAADWITTKFGGLLAFAKDVFGGISDAMAAGDLQLAAEVMWAAIRLAWATGMEWILTEWANLQFELTDLWGKVAFGVLDTCNWLWSGMIDGFWTAADAIVDAWKWAEKTLAKGVGWIIAKLEGLDPADVIANLAQDYARQQAGRDSGRADRDARDKAAADARYQANEAARQQWGKDAAAKRDTRLAGASDELEKARREYQDARDKAAKAKAAADAQAKNPPPPPGAPQGLPAAVETATPLAKASGGLGSQSFYQAWAKSQDPTLRTQQGILKATQAVAKNTDPKKSAVKLAVAPGR